jgi:NADPH:quinone reductase
MDMAEDMMRSVAWDAGAQSFCEIRAPRPVAQGFDLVIEVSAVALNPVDLKIKAGVGPNDPPRQLGFDACGRVVAAGPEASGINLGDRVYYAGSAIRPGSNATHQLVDARLVARAPETLDDAQAAALPLTALTAWEAMFERLGLTALASTPQTARVLIINGAGGVGSIALQLARVSGLRVTATASRPEGQAWCRAQGAAEVIDHAALAGLPDSSFDKIFCCHDTATYFREMTRLVAPQGAICSIVGMPQPQVLAPLFQKSASFSWEYMFTRSMFQTADMARQGEILAHVARLVDAGDIRSTASRVMEGLSVETFTQAHAAMAQGRQIGKLVVRF